MVIIKEYHVEQLNLIKKWMCTQEYLPQNIDEKFLKAILHCCEYDIDQTKLLTEKCLTIRSKAPELFQNRDVTEEWTWNYLIDGAIVHLPKRTKENYTIGMCLPIKDYRKLNMTQALKGITMVHDLFFITEEVADGLIAIVDASPIGLMHLSKITPISTLRKYLEYQQEGYPLRIKQIHIINMSYIWGKLMMLLKPFLKSEIINLIHVHNNIETLYQFVPKECLPEDYGGELPKLENIKNDQLKKLCDKREYFLDDSKWKVDVSKRKITS